MLESGSLMAQTFECFVMFWPQLGQSATVIVHTIQASCHPAFCSTPQTLRPASEALDSLTLRESNECMTQEPPAGKQGETSGAFALGPRC